MTEKRYVYVLEKYPFYESTEILMISLSCDEILTEFVNELMKLSDYYGLHITKFELGKSYSKDYAKTIIHIEKEDGEIKYIKIKILKK